MRVAASLLLILMLAGCASKFNGDIIDEKRCDTIQGIMGYETLSENNFPYKKIYCDFEKAGEMVVEEMNTTNRKLTKIEIKEKELEDIEKVFKEALQDICPECVAKSEKEADIIIKSKIIRFVGHVKDFEISGDESAFFSGGDRRIKLEYQSALTIETDIAGKASYFDHIVDLDLDMKFHVEKMYAVLAANTKMRNTSEFVTKYDSIPLATGAIIVAQEMGSFFAVPVMSNEMSGYVDIYDLSRLEVARHLDLATGDIDWWWTGRIQEDAKKEMIDLYSSGVGNLRYLIYDYIKNLLEEMRDAS
ncbi:hypothetical protein [uncultured Trichococcus sp.]|uniref:hypothetical protein n=1 Tax=uncultured Trichococcus sp. TaxID=189665 RepID=UPI0029C63B10|nr:hypothetical protein [uncultured Trichococcus sp.]